MHSATRNLRNRWRYSFGVAFLCGLYWASTATDAFAQPKAAPPMDVRSSSPVAKPSAPGKGSPTAPGKKATPGKSTPNPTASQAAPKDAKPVTRPVKPPKPPSAEELKAKPDDDGKIAFSFHGQPWQGVLEWLAEISHMSLDWQELPGGYINLTTQQRYTVEQARDIINAQLFARGYTMLENGEVLSVVNLKKLDAGLVPRARPDGLDKLQPHAFVKVSFPLDRMIAAEAVEELKPMLSPNGKLTQLKSTNRLEAMDSVANLREIHRLLTEEQAPTESNRLLQRFALLHTRATDVKEQLLKLLGIEEKKASGPVSSQQQRQMQQMAMMRAQQQAKGGKSNAKKSDVHLVANVRDNSILANAPPDKMAMIAEAIEVIDQPLERPSLLANLEGVKVYRLVGIDPDVLVRTLEDRGDLAPTTRLEVDKQNKAIIAFANPIDHATIGMLVKKLDGSGRHFEVLPLRRLAADYVAGTIEFMMGAEEEEENQRGGYFSFFSSRRGQQSEKSKDKFKVDADVEGNKLLLYANDIEMSSVQDLLVKMGEIPPAGGSRETVRLIDVEPGKDTEELLEKIRRIWPSFAPDRDAPNPLKIAPPAKSAEDEDREPDSTPPVIRTPKETTTTKVDHHFGSKLRTIAYQGEKEAPGADDAPRPDAAPKSEAGSAGREEPNRRAPARSTPPPITIRRRPDGGLVIESDDTAALDILQDLMADLAPAPKEYAVFHLKHADSYWVKFNLEDFFEEEDESKGNSRNSFYDYYYGYRRQETKKNDRRLSKRKPLTFIEDEDTNTILVQGADRSQLKTIGELIELYDKPQAADSYTARQTLYYQVKYSKAKVIEQAIKEVYRDLLSSSDKEFGKQQNDKDKKPTANRIYTYIDTGGADDKRTAVRFKGLLSIGVDPYSNSLLVSAPENLMANVKELIETLDRAAQPSSNIQVVKTDRRLNSATIRAKLAEILDTREKKQPQNATDPSAQQKKIGGGQPNQPAAKAGE